VPVSILVNTALPRRASKEALRRETIMPWFNDFHRSGANPGFMHVSTEPKKRILFLMGRTDTNRFVSPPANEKHQVPDAPASLPSGKAHQEGFFVTVPPRGVPAYLAGFIIPYRL
jgi:hypothetical protein